MDATIVPVVWRMLGNTFQHNTLLVPAVSANFERTAAQATAGGSSRLARLVVELRHSSPLKKIKTSVL